MNLSWNLARLYPSFDSSEYKNDFIDVEKQISILKKTASNAVNINELQILIQSYVTAYEKYYNLLSYCVAVLALETQNERGLAEDSKARALGSQLNQINIELLFKAAELNEEDWNKLFQPNEMKPLLFTFSFFKKRKAQLLDKEREKLAEQLFQFGPQAFGTLYNEISGKIRIQLNSFPNKEMSKAEVLNLLFQDNKELRKEAWLAVQKEMEKNKEVFAAILNSIYGYRTSISATRKNYTQSIDNKEDYLDVSLAQAKINRKTLEAMYSAIESEKNWIQEIGMTMGKAVNQGKLNPWDIMGPAPMKLVKKYDINEALDLIKKSFSVWTNEFDSFIDNMTSNEAIDSNVTSTRTGGAFQMYFPRNKQSMVFLTFEGSFGNVSTLAHELGHAYHSFLQKDLHISEINNPMTLAETASVFAQFCLNDYLLANAKEDETKKMALWEFSSDTFMFLINIAARFEFEKLAHEARKKTVLSAKDFCQLTEQAWGKWYGDSLASYDPYYWAHKMHFSMSKVEFYNYPYTFGFLFSLCLYAELKQKGPEFFSTYKEILKNTGRMTAEELVAKFLNKDITQKEFWSNGLKMVKAQTELFQQYWNVK
jgi:oligoendopeptidase F